MKNTDKKLPCDTSGIFVTSSVNGIAYIQYFNKDFVPITLFTTSDKSGDDLKLMVNYIFINSELHKSTGECIGIAKTGEISCDVENIESFSIKKMNFKTSGGDKYLVK